MLLFAISFILVFVSSYFLASVFAKKPYQLFIYTMTTAFAQIVLTFEILSLFKAINNEFLVLLFNTFFLTASLFLWFKKDKPIVSCDFKNFFRRLINVCKLDKILAVACFGFVFMLFISFVLNLVMPNSSADGADYHIARSVWYLIYGSLNHFHVSDVRAVVFPFNSEILYAWVVLFVKREVFFGFFSMSGFLLAISSIYKMMQILGFSLRKILWSICVVSSFCSVLMQVSGSETDVLVSGLILSSLVLFWISIKEDDKSALFFASLLYALAIGTKTTAIIAIPAIALLMGYISYRYKNYKNILYFLAFGVLNFLIFSSYNYFLNLIEYGNISGPNAVMAVHKNLYGIKGVIASFVRHIFLFFDFSGFKWGIIVGKYILKVKMFILSLLSVSSVPEGAYSKPDTINGTLLEPRVGVGILGFILCLPVFVFTFIRQFFTKNFREKFLGMQINSFFIYVMSLSSIICFMNFNTRFLTMFIVILAPVFSFVYFKRDKVLKTVLVLIMSYYFFLVSTHLWPRPLYGYLKLMVIHKETIRDVRTRVTCSNIYAKKGESFNVSFSFWTQFVKTYDLKDKKILFFTSTSSDLLIPGMLTLKGIAHIDLATILDFSSEDLTKYDYVVFTGRIQRSTNFKNEQIELESLNNAMALKPADKYCFFSRIDGKVVLTGDYNKDLSKAPYTVECLFDKKLLQSLGFKKEPSILDYYIFRK